LSKLAAHLIREASIMRKAEAKHRHTHKLERLQRFLNWTTERHPDFAPKKNHQEKWFSTYLGFQPPEIGRAARLFWLGLDDATVEANLEGAAPASLIGRLLNRDVNDFSCTVDIFGVEKTLDCGPVQNLLEPEFALRIDDSRSTDEFEHNVCAAVQTLVRDRLHVLEKPFTSLSDEQKAQCLERLPARLSRLDDFAARAVDIVNEVKHELRYVVELRHGELALDMQRRITGGQGHVLSEQEVAALKEEDRQAMNAKFEMMIEEAQDFDLQLLGEKRLTEVFMMEPKKTAPHHPLRPRGQPGKDGLCGAAGKQPALRPLPQALRRAADHPHLDRPARPDQQRQDLPGDPGHDRRDARHLPLAAATDGAGEPGAHRVPGRALLAGYG